MMQGSPEARHAMPAWPIVMLGVGVFLCVVGVMFVMFAPKTDHLTAEAEGIVSRVELEVNQSKKRKSRTYLTYVRFEDGDHREFEARSVVNGGTKRHSEGDVVTVQYDPLDPAAGCLIVGDEDRLVMFKALQYLCQFGGPAVALIGGAATLFFVLRRRRAS